MLVTRYHLAAAQAAGKVVLEVACGAGIGLGYLAQRARRAVGGDYSAALLRKARRQYGARIPLIRLDAAALPFAPASFDVVVCYEAIYYFPAPARFLSEVVRVLRPGGVLVLCTVNSEWVDFNPSPFAVRYHSADELRALVEASGLGAMIEGAFPSRNEGIGQMFVSLVKRAAITLGMMPKTMRGKQLLKRVFLGDLTPLPAEFHDGIAEVVPRVALAPGPVHDFKVIYVTARKAP
jgi:SAM-dependent methyltransferase